MPLSYIWRDAKVASCTVIVHSHIMCDPLTFFSLVMAQSEPKHVFLTSSDIMYGKRKILKFETAVFQVMRPCNLSGGY
jgi:hypothetical protein